MCSWRPVKLGVIASLARPGDNITGVSFLINELAAKKRPRAASCWSRPSLSVQSSCSASTGQKAASCSNAIFMDGSFACGARFLASARNRLPAHGAASEVMARGFRQSRLLWHGYPAASSLHLHSRGVPPEGSRYRTINTKHTYLVAVRQR